MENKKYRLQDLIDMDHFQNLQDRLNEIYSFPSAIIDNDGNILTATAWQDICTQFHRKNKDSERHCIKSDQYIQRHLYKADPAVSYRCPHGLVDNAMPIIIDGVHYGNFFTGQFFLEDPDMDFFRAQAKKYGFKEDEYLDAVKKVPIWSQKQLDNYLFFIKGLIAVISESGLKRMKEREIRKQMEAKEDRLRAILKTALDGFWLTDIKGQLLEVNDSYCLMSGYCRDELLTLHIADLEANQRPEIIDMHMKKVVTQGSDRFESRHRRKDGTVFDVEISVQFHAEEGGQCVGFIREITERKQAEAERERLQAQLNQAQKMESIGTLAGGIAHDFNNILFPIVGHTEMLLDDLPEESTPVRDSLNEIYTSALRARDLVHQILAFARQEKTELKLMKMQPIIKEALKLIRSTIPSTISIRQNIQPGCGGIMADPTQIHQIIMNLTTNAYHAMAENGGELTVGLKQIESGDNDRGNPEMPAGAYACLSVADTGIGMDKDVMGRIFDPFFTTKKQGKGTGMGLSMIHGIVAGMKGVIRVNSSPGKGTEFRVYLPVAGKASEIRGFKANVPIPGGCEKILIVDDEEAIIAIEKQILGRLGYHVTSFTGSMEALEMFRADPDHFDLVLTDMAMPHMPGDKLAVELMKIRPDIPILLVTGFSERMTEDKIKTIGVRGLVLKPIIVKDLAKRIREVLDA